MTYTPEEEAALAWAELALSCSAEDANAAIAKLRPLRKDPVERIDHTASRILARALRNREALAEIETSIKRGETHWAPAPVLPVKSPEELDRDEIDRLWLLCKSPLGVSFQIFGRELLKSERAAVWPHIEKLIYHHTGHEQSRDWLRARCSAGGGT